LGYMVECVADGAAAVEAFTRANESGRPFDAVILDLTVPGGMGGQEALEKIHEIDPKAKVIVSSGYADDPVLADYRRYGFSGAVAKPYEISELSRILFTIINR
ncbi:MAG: response regulator, partial [bacterium]